MESKHYERILNIEASQEVKSRSAATAAAHLIVLAIHSVFLYETIINNFLISVFAVGIFTAAVVRIYMGMSKKVKSLELFGLVINLQALMWSLFLYQLLKLEGIASASFTISAFTMSGIASSSLYSLSFNKKIFSAFTALMLSPIIIYFALNNMGFNYYIFPVSTVIFYLYLNKVHSYIYENWAQSVLNKHEMKSVINSFPGGISVIKNGHYYLVNTWVESLMGHRAEYFYEKKLGFFDHDSQFAHVVENFINSTDRERKIELPIKTKDGIRQHLFLLKRMPFPENSFVIGSVDVHDLKESEKLIAKQQAQLEVSAKMASIGEMSSGLAHEINNPLSVILSKSQIILRELEAQTLTPERTKQHVDRILKTAERIFVIVKGLRNLARGANETEFQVYSLNQIIADSLSIAEVKMKHSQVEFINKIRNFDLQIECHPVQISQVLINVIGNSCDAIEKVKEKWISIELEANQEYIKLIVTDSGGGIPEDLREKILKPFYTTKEMGKGTGLGLSISQGIIQSHNGRFYFNHESPNTQVIIELPIRQPKTEANQAA